ncbi:hypothetical protein FKW77_002654 [Venturia effusa]|uniref:Major facilitator superfamily (MFS) profile domain-containing protein n=1 Tax=Venturia effusa TaxID=50376 RepID=A0A517L8U4_9PEZI|nr:hypothetical protein FKW77_002654 [Venturia effusa]
MSDAGAPIETEKKNQTLPDPNPPNLLPSSSDLKENIKAYPKIIGYVFAVAPGMILFGFDGVIVSTLVAVPVFKEHYGDLFGTEYIIPAMWLSLWTAASPIGIMIGAMVAGWIQEKLGRRLSLIIGAVVGIVGIGTCFGSNYAGALQVMRGIFLLGKLIEGACTGMVACTTQTYASEIVPHVLHGAVFATFPAFILLGQLVAAGVLASQLQMETPRGYLTAIAVQWVFSLIVIALTMILPESPTWLVRQNRMESALASEQRLQKATIDCTQLINDIAATLEQEKLDTLHQRPATLFECFQGRNRWRTLIVIFGNILPQLFGLTLLGNASYFLQLLGLDAHRSISLLQVGIAIGLVANLIGIWTIGKFNSTMLMFSTLAASGILFLGISIAGFWYGVVPLWWTAVSFVLIIFIAGLGVWPASVLIASQASSLRLRGKTQAIGWLVQGLNTGVFSIVLPYIYNPDAGNARGKTAFLFVGLCFISVLLTWLYVPEMKGRSAANIDALFERGVPARKWGTYTVDGEAAAVEFQAKTSMSRESVVD